MNPHSKAAPTYQFGPFQVYAEDRLLLREKQAVPVTPKVFDALLFLVERNGRLVTKDELMNALWPGTFVTESNLTQTIFMLRKALGESASEQRYILTVPGSGYRFAGEVRRVDRDAAAFPIVSPPAAGRTAAWLRPGILAVVLSVLVLSAVVIYHYARPSQAQGGPGASRVMLAILPFKNLTGDASQDYFSDGFTEDTIIEVGKRNPGRLGVIALTSVTNYRHAPKPLPQIGRELGVQYLVEGSIRREGNKVQITAELIRLGDQRHLWAEQYERNLNDVAGVPLTISEAIAREIEDPGAGKAMRVPQPTISGGNYEAYNLLLKARYSLSKRTPESLAQAAEYYRQTIALDPGNARPIAELAATYLLLSSYSVGRQNESMPKARETALKAIALDEHLSEGHSALGLIAETYDWDWQSAEKEFRRAIELDPNNATAHQWYAEHLSWRGRFPEAFVEIERARALDPGSLIIAADRGSILYYSRQYDRAVEQFRTILDIEPSFTHAHVLAEVYIQQGRFDAALADIQNWRSKQETPWTVVALGLLYAHMRKPREAEQFLAQLREIDSKEKLDPAAFGAILAALGKNDLALEALEKAVQQHSTSITGLKVNPVWDPLRSDPRFTALLRRVNLEP